MTFQNGRIGGWDRLPYDPFLVLFGEVQTRNWFEHFCVDIEGARELKESETAEAFATKRNIYRTLSEVCIKHMIYKYLPLLKHAV